MSAQEYNRKRIAEGTLTDAHLVALIECWQRHHGLAVDGFAGPNTIASLNRERASSIGTTLRHYPLLLLPDGRKPIITSGFYTENPSRPSHMGVDFFYEWRDSDPDVPVGNGGAVMRNGKRRWWYPPEDSFPGASMFIAPVDGMITVASQSTTGYRIWLQFGSLRVGGFHLKQLLVSVGDNVFAGQPLGIVGDNPSEGDAKHLHFEVSPASNYAPMNPRKWLEGATYLSAPDFP